VSTALIPSIVSFPKFRFDFLLSSQSVQLREESTSDSLSSSLKVEDSSRRESLSSLLAEKGSTITGASLKEDTSTSASQLEELQVQSEECSSESIVSEIQTSSALKSVKETKDTKEIKEIKETKETSSFSASTTSATKDDSLKETVAEFLATEKIVSAKESFSTEAAKSADECLKKVTASSVSSSSTTASQRALFVGTDESRRESLLSQASEGRLTHSDPEDEEPDDDEDEHASVKESRSKSIATIMMTSIYKPSEDIESIDPLAEEEHEHVDLLGQEATSALTSTSTTTTSKTTTLLQSSEQSSSTTTSSSSKTSASKVESITLTQIDQQSGQDQAQFQAEPADRKTPPTAPVSPSVKPLSSTGSAGSVIGAGAGTGAGAAGGKCESSAASIVSSSGPLSPKDISGKSSPGGLTSESQSIPTPLGRESHTETPESSPKPTSPFPRVTKDELKSLEIQVSQKSINWKYLVNLIYS